MAAIVALLFLIQTPKDRIMTFEQYSHIHHPLPYILDITQGNGHIVYFGFKHSRDPKDPQFKQLRNLWLSEHPQEILDEDITAQPHATLEESIRYDGERGAVAFWAKQDHIPLRSIDMTWKQEAESLTKTFPKQQVKLFYLIRGLQQDLKRPNGQSNTRSPEQVAQGDLQMLKSQGLDWPPNDVAQIDETWKTLAIKGDWRQPQIEWIDPTNNGPLNRIGQACSEVRDEHMVQVITQELHKGKTILVVVGASHVVMQQPALPGTIRRLGS